MNDQLPNATMRTLGIVLVAVFDIARDGFAKVVERIRPLVEPPDDVRVVSTVGGIYTGIFVVERNTIIAGVVVEVGRVTAAAPRGPLVTPSPHYDRGRFDRRDAGDGRLPGWSDDPRDLFREEDEPWRR